jgi:hypothetical protein
MQPEIPSRWIANVRRHLVATTGEVRDSLSAHDFRPGGRETGVPRRLLRAVSVRVPPCGRCAPRGCCVHRTLWLPLLPGGGTPRPRHRVDVTQPMVSLETARSLWYSSQVIPGVRYRLNDIVTIASGPHIGATAWVISIEDVDPEPSYLIERISGSGDLILLGA